LQDAAFHNLCGFSSILLKQYCRIRRAVFVKEPETEFSKQSTKLFKTSFNPVPPTQLICSAAVRFKPRPTRPMHGSRFLRILSGTLIYHWLLVRSNWMRFRMPSLVHPSIFRHTSAKTSSDLMNLR
jgi:hypothetical protein